MTAVTRILSIDFVGAKPLTGGAGGGTLLPVMDLPAMKPTEIAGAKPAPQWNSAAGYMGALPGLTLSDGTVTSTSVTWNSPVSATGRGTWWRGFADAPGDVRMMNGYLDPHSAESPDAPATVVVSTLPPSITAPGYDVYVYTEGDLPAGAVRTAVYSIGATTLTVADTGPIADHIWRLPVGDPTRGNRKLRRIPQFDRRLLHPDRHPGPRRTGARQWRPDRIAHRAMTTPPMREQRWQWRFSCTC